MPIFADMNEASCVLCITGSDPIGGAGLQADVRTSSGLGGCVSTVVTAVRCGEDAWFDLPVGVVMDQVRAVMRRMHPRVVRIGMVRTAELAEALRCELEGRCQVVAAPGILSFDGRPLVAETEIPGIARGLLPLSSLLMLRVPEAELLLQMSIAGDNDMLLAARLLCGRGARWVLLRGAVRPDGRLSALLYGDGFQRFFSSYHEGWSGRGVGAAFSAAVALALDAGGDVPSAVQRAHDYLHACVVYVRKDEETGVGRPADLYDRFLGLLEQHCKEQHEIRNYASMLCISPRRLSQVTATVVGKTPRQVLDSFLVGKAKELLGSTRLTVQEIARRLGFSSETVFCKFFRRQTGQAPGSSRK